MKEVMFGCAEADITPTYPVRTLGFSEERMNGLREWKASSRTDSGVEIKRGNLLFITLDHIGFSKIKAQELREKVSARLRTETEK